MHKAKFSSGRIAIFLHIIIWTAILLLPWFFSTPSRPYNLIGHLPVPFFLIAGFINLGLFYANVLFFYPLFCNRRKWGIYILSLAGLFILANFLKALIFHAWFPMIHIQRGDNRFIFAPTFFFLFAGTIYRFLVNSVKAEKMQEELRAEKLSMELKFLRSQISPHFIFNVLTTLVSLARKRSNQLEPSLIMLSDLMRYMLYDSDTEKITLAREVDYLKNYIDLQRLRFGDDIDIQMDISLSDAAKQYLIEPMLLIPFVENAFKHGISQTREPGIQINVKAAEGTLTFMVKNSYNIEEGQNKDNSSGIGLSNVQTRLGLLYPHRHKLTISDNNNTFIISLTLQLI